MSDKSIIDIMNNIIEDMKNKTPEELFNCLYNNSEHFKKQWDNFTKKELKGVTYSKCAQLK